jgi:hypothetical protein
MGPDARSDSAPQPRLPAERCGDALVTALVTAAVTTLVTAAERERARCVARR